MNNLVVYGILALSLAVNAYQVYRIDTYKYVTNILDQKDRLTQSGYSELLYSHINSLKNDQLEAAKSQGKIEGILSMVNNIKPESNEISSIWHSGYYRGMDQVEYVRTVAYEDGYHKACDDMNCPAGGGSERFSPNPKKDMPLPTAPVKEQPKDAKNPIKIPQVEFKPLSEKK